MTRAERIRLNLESLETLKNEGKISVMSYVYQHEKLTNELNAELGVKPNTKVTRISVNDERLYDEDDV